MVQVPEGGSIWLPSLKLGIFRRAHVVDVKMLPDKKIKSKLPSTEKFSHPFSVPCWLWLSPLALGLIHRVSDSKKFRPEPSSTLQTGTATG